MILINEIALKLFGSSNEPFLWIGQIGRKLSGIVMEIEHVYEEWIYIIACAFKEFRADSVGTRTFTNFKSTYCKYNFICRNGIV